MRGAPGVHVALQLLAVPVYCVALLQPHATLLFWLASGAAHTALQASPLGALPARAQAQGAPGGGQAKEDGQAEASAGAARGGGGTASSSGAGGVDEQLAGLTSPPLTSNAELLMGLGGQYCAWGRKEAAAVCFRQALRLGPEAGGRWRALAEAGLERTRSGSGNGPGV